MGSVIAAIRPVFLLATPVLRPWGPPVLPYQGPANDFRTRVGANRAESRSLAATRDGLLPKLLSGEIEVWRLL